MNSTPSETSQERHKSASRLGLKNSEKTPRRQVFSSTVPEKTQREDPFEPNVQVYIH